MTRGHFKCTTWTPAMGQFLTADGQVLGGIPTSLEGLRSWRVSVMDKIDVARSEIALQERRIEDLRRNQAAVEQAIADFERSAALEVEGSLGRLSIDQDSRSPPVAGSSTSSESGTHSESEYPAWGGFVGFDAEDLVDLEAEEDNGEEEESSTEEYGMSNEDVFRARSWSPVGSDEL
ncbi:hypothetical protein BV25DRAFT_1917698 [Artomyces pyxidatus]|uniref:Uncharacterized protein n=1 Tax=Artomyces pyxidatus TaxID=48021 RepID=A0ACB8SVW3_9AGAM|nr:hypothetical protein BV25DRAFT_1917698 [Artomyces pyxidatus]